MKKDRIGSQIKKLNADRARYHKDLLELEQRYRDHKLSAAAFEKKKQKNEEKCKKIKTKIHDLEVQLHHCEET